MRGLIAVVGALFIATLVGMVVFASQQPDYFKATNRCLINGFYQECPPGEKPGDRQKAALNERWSVRQWPLFEWNEKGVEGVDNVRLDVVETRGVCIYVALRNGENVALVAVPKKDLPTGVGCQ